MVDVDTSSMGSSGEVEVRARRRLVRRGSGAVMALLGAASCLSPAHEAAPARSTSPSATPPVAGVCDDPLPALAELEPGPCGAPPSWKRESPNGVHLRVDAGAPGPAWNRFYETAVAADHANTLLCTAWGRNIRHALSKAHDEAGFRYVRFHGILDDDVGVYSEDAQGTARYDWTRLDRVYDVIAAAGMRPIVEISFTPKALASNPAKVQRLLWYAGASPNVSPARDWGRWQDLMAELVKHLEQRYGAEEVRNRWYFEVWNEPSWMYAPGDAGYLELYENTAAGLVRGDAAVRVGGPAGSAGESPSLIAALVAAAKAKHWKLDFITYHRYGDDGGKLADAEGMQTFHRSLVEILTNAGFTGELVNDEFGPSAKPDRCRDDESAASFVAETVHRIGTDPSFAPPVALGYWAISDLYEEFDTGSALAYREGNYGLFLKGDPRIAESYDVAKPAFNAFRLLHRMAGSRLPVTGALPGEGLNATATLADDKRSIQVLVYDHRAGPEMDAASLQPTAVSITVDRTLFPPGAITVRRFAVDHDHANSHTAWVAMGKPAQPTRAQWGALRDAAKLCYDETLIGAAASAWSIAFDQPVYGVSLVEIAPAPSRPQSTGGP
jgi:xylan 1,4-beta-xylosidase